MHNIKIVEADRISQIQLSFFETIYGKCYVCCTDDGICEVGFALSDEKKIFNSVQSNWPNAKIKSISFDQFSESKKLQKYLDNEYSDSFQLLIAGSAFQIEVWKAIFAIPQGQTLTYSQLAMKINNPKAYRAVASACGKNKIAILIPCHRVISKSGSLGGYKWGLSLKMRIITDESNRLDTLKHGDLG